MLNKHLEKAYHKKAVIKVDAFIRVMSGQQVSIRVQLDDAAKQVVASNGKKLHSIVETIVPCGRQKHPSTWSS